MVISEQLKRAVVQSGETHYKLAKETGVDSRTLDRFMSGEQSNIQSGTVDALCAYLGLELCQKKGRTTPKQPAKKPATSRKRSAKKK